jgi:hypothetical protein
MGGSSQWPAEVRESLIGAHRLAEFLARGGEPEPIEADVRLVEGERLYSVQPFRMSQYAPRDRAPYQRIWLGLGSPLMIAGGLLASGLIGGLVQKQAAAEAAVPRWQVLGNGTLYITNLRFGLFAQETGWSNLAYDAIRDTDLVYYDGIVFFFDQLEPMKLSIPWPEYHFLLFQYFAYGRCIPFELPAGLEGLGVQMPESRSVTGPARSGS